MNLVQEYKITRTETGSEWFFFAHSFKSAYHYAQEFLKRNGAEGYKLYRRNTSFVGDKWLEERV